MKRVKFVVTILLLTLFLIEFSTPILAQSESVVSITEGQLPLPESLVFYKGSYAIINDAIEMKINNTINLSTHSMFTKTTLYLNSSILYNNKTFELPFGVTQASGVTVNNSIIYYVLAHEGNVTFSGTSSQITSLLSLVPNVTLYYVYFNGTSLSYIPIIKNSNITSVITNGYMAFAIIKNESYYTLVEINGTKVVSKYMLNITQAIQVSLLAFSSNYVVIAINYFGSPQVGVNETLYNIEVYDIQSKSITKTFTNIVSPPSTVYNSNNSLFIITTNNTTSLINASGYILTNISTPTSGVPLSYMYYNDLLITISLTSISLGGVTFTVNTYVYMNGKWLKYDNISFTSTSIEQINVPIGVEAYPTQFKLIIFQQAINTSTQQTTISYYYYTVPLSKPTKPEFKMEIQQEPGITEVFLNINEPNATLLGVNSISIYLNSTLIGTYPPNIKVVSFNITKNGTYLITVTASNIFGNTSMSKIETITVEPAPVTTTARSTTTSTVATTTTPSITTTTTTTSSVSTLTTSSSVLTVTYPTTTTSSNITNYIIVAIVVVIIIAIVIILLRRK